MLIKAAGGGLVRAFTGVLVLLAAVLTGCGPGGDPPSQRPAPTSWWKPEPGQFSNWDWQIDEPYDLSARRDMYDLDLFDLAPAGSQLRYRDGEAIDLPPGPLAGMIDVLHARVPRPVVICYLDTGAYEHYRPDAPRFPGHRAHATEIPDRPEPPKPGSVIGWNTGWEEERWLDIRKASRGAFAEIIWARLDLARRIGCDGVEPDQNNLLGNAPGFAVTLADQLSWYREVAAQAHRRGLSVGMKNGHDQRGAAAALVDVFDWALPEECAEHGECAELEVFIKRGKAVFAVDYEGSVDPATACRAHRRHGFDGLIKDEPPTARHRRQCSR
ncbi:endo alpha-1,4 polygalactosaminidase [Actinomadura rugatobispora]|uniref:Endo alpha-1,4 polygalactosaminidase n=1 Tax=Actinomadura rugatobispora TaxID=1994 RepID=A0ABW1AIT0_9ACTN|nr:endo alpha-1,4 polygalactosaminidase [Actinomadura rugatobispora]